MSIYLSDRAGETMTESDVNSKEEKSLVSTVFENYDGIVILFDPLTLTEFKKNYSYKNVDENGNVLPPSNDSFTNYEVLLINLLYYNMKFNDEEQQEIKNIIRKFSDDEILKDITFDEDCQTVQTNIIEKLNGLQEYQIDQIKRKLGKVFKKKMKTDVAVQLGKMKDKKIALQVHKSDREFDCIMDNNETKKKIKVIEEEMGSNCILRFQKYIHIYKKDKDNWGAIRKLSPIVDLEDKIKFHDKVKDIKNLTGEKMIERFNNYIFNIPTSPTHPVFEIIVKYALEKLLDKEEEIVDPNDIMHFAGLCFFEVYKALDLIKSLYSLTDFNDSPICMENRRILSGHSMPIGKNIFKKCVNEHQQKFLENYADNRTLNSIQWICSDNTELDKLLNKDYGINNVGWWK